MYIPLIHKLGFGKNTLDYISEDWVKYKLPALERYEIKPMPLIGIYRLIPSEVTNIEIKTLEGLKKFNVLLYNTRNYLIEALNIENIYFDFCSELALKIQIKEITRPKNSFQLEELIDLLEIDFKTL
jgi:hypothetical protein